MMITSVRTKAGTFLLESSKRGITKLYFPGAARPIKTDKRLPKTGINNMNHAAAALKTYFRGAAPGARVSFSKIKFDLSGCTAFQSKVLRTLQKIPAGKTTTYGELAKKAGSPKAARAVGRVMNKNRIPILFPCHRVVGSTGSLVGYAKGLGWKKKLLALEASKGTFELER